MDKQSETLPTAISRRTVLTGALLTGAATALPISGAQAVVQADPIDGSTLPRFGAACLTAAVVAMAVHDGHAYVITRGIVPPKLVEIDLTTRQVTRTIDLPVGEGGWGITVAAGKIYVGLYPVADVYCFDPVSAELTRVGSLAGAGGFVWDMTTAPDGQEAKTLTWVEDGLYSAIYPSTEVVRINPRTKDVQSFGTIGHDQIRPWQAAYDVTTKLLAIASAPGTGKLTGALTLLDTRTGALEVYYGVVPDQSVMSVSIVDGIAYLGGDVVGGGGITPTRSAAAIGAFDLNRRKLLWTVDPLAGERSIQSVAVQDGILYGVLKRTSGGWFTYDLTTRAVVRGTNKLSGYGEIYSDRTGVYCETNFGGNLYQLGPGLTEAKLLVNRLGDGWYTVPQLSPVRGGPPHSVWGLADRDLVQLPLP